VADAWKRSGQTTNAFCRARRLTRSNFDRWRRTLAAGSIASSLVPVRVVAGPMAEVVPHSGVVVRLPLGAAPAAVSRLPDARPGRHARTT
jgi:hypothetical protein